MRTLITAIAILISLSASAQTKTYISVIKKAEITNILCATDQAPESISNDTVKNNVRSTGNFFVEPKNVAVIANRQLSAFQGEGLVIIISEKIFLLRAKYNDYGKLTSTCTVATELSISDIQNCSMLVLGVKQ